ncbi:uncharacterized protein LOC130978933 [Arachis stenosperma]|uniref:uncharacterized protein LOC130978933 n=1 Tax=Arachis stenosperma TaxID=217475 RepID=UPI0025AD673E|nr:uncharacterized protein LOC130978933 [Arachis stenosperma]
MAIKSQYLADFIAEYTNTPGTLIDWNLYVDGSSNKAGSGAGVILESDQGTQLELSLWFMFPASNNQAEYEALLAGLKLAREVGAQKLTIFSDSQIEAEPLAVATAQRSQKFLYRNIVTRFGVPYSIIMDDGTQFTDTGFRNMVADLKIKHQITSVEHPQANGQAKAANKVILVGLKRRLQDTKGAWAEELPQVLWAYRTTPYSTTGESPFRIAYGMEAMIPVEVNEKSSRVIFYNEDANSQALKEELDLLPEVEERAWIREEALKR